MTNDEINQKIGEGFGVEPLKQGFRIAHKNGTLIAWNFGINETAKSISDSHPGTVIEIRRIYPDFCSSVDECLKVVLKEKLLISLSCSYGGDLVLWEAKLYSLGCGYLANSSSMALALTLVKYLEARK